VPSPENKPLQSWFAPVFKAAGFKKTGATWHRKQPLLIHVFNIQDSQWSRSFYFNLGVYLKDLGGLDRPLEYHCHVRQRLLDFMAGREGRRRFTELSDFEHHCAEEERRHALVATVTDHAIPWFDRVSEPGQFRQYLLQEHQHSILIWAPARVYLDLPPPYSGFRSDSTREVLIGST
jgi:hypothetical protein